MFRGIMKLYWDIIYTSNGDGVITYKWVVNKERYTEYAAYAAATAVCVVMISRAIGGQSRMTERIVRTEASLA